jgi:hypothetical protein
MRAYRSVENGATIAPEVSATMYDHTGSVVSPLSTHIRPAQTEDVIVVADVVGDIACAYRQRTLRATEECTTTRELPRTSAWQSSADQVGSCPESASEMTRRMGPRKRCNGRGDRQWQWSPPTPTMRLIQSAQGCRPREAPSGSIGNGAS